jgi:DNA repair photolyase
MPFFRSVSIDLDDEHAGPVTYFKGEQMANTALDLFPTSVPLLANPLVGIARLAADGKPIDSGHEVSFKSLKVRSILNKSVSRRRLSFGRSINPYRGCEFACRYCYARYTHEFMELKDPAAFEREIFIKQNAAWLLKQELRELKPDEEIALGTATDPYQPIERRACVTRSLLEVFAQCRNLRIGIVTKSTLIERDIDLLLAIAERNTLVVHLTITTTDAKLARLMEPRAPRPDLRFETVNHLRAAGLKTGVLCSPLLPGLTDKPGALDKVAVAAKAAGASFLCAQPLFLKSCSRETYLEFVRQHFPELTDMYAKRFGDADFVSRAYAQRIRQMVHGICSKHGLAERSSDALLTRNLGAPEANPDFRQGTLFASMRPASLMSVRPQRRIDALSA